MAPKLNITGRFKKKAKRTLQLSESDQDDQNFEMEDSLSPTATNRLSGRTTTSSSQAPPSPPPEPEVEAEDQPKLHPTAATALPPPEFAQVIYNFP
ncbi:hypothetical protein LINGRAPRIM_LOCUS3417, partial [Linum grandiflorum]